LIVGKQVFLQSKAPSSHEDQGTAIELMLPLEDYWKLSEKLKSATYLLASGETQNEVSTVLKDVYKICARYAVAEKDRLWLHAKIREI
jgi:hypothetical protein